MNDSIAVTASGVVATLRAREPALRQAGITRLSLFGSVARNEAGPDSDIDLAAEFDSAAKMDLIRLVGLEQELGDLLGARGPNPARTYPQRAPACQCGARPYPCLLSDIAMQTACKISSTLQRESNGMLKAWVEKRCGTTVFDTKQSNAAWNASARRHSARETEPANGCRNNLGGRSGG